MLLERDANEHATPYEPPPMRDRLPTLPHDLREYAWIHTGPPSETRLAAAPTDANDASREDDGRDASDANDANDANDEMNEMNEIETGLLVDLWHSDVPRVAATDTTVCSDHREAFVLSLLDGESTVGALLEIADLPVAEVLAILCELCARGVVTLDRSRRIDTPVPNAAA